ncbi:MAG: hypothetical protein GY778_27415 [bacterium]|nr:hypothetical protein [bacterium]
MVARYRNCALALLLALLATAPACRRHEPPTLVAKDLGTGDRPLPPTPLTEYELTGLKGKATPQRAADVDAEPEADDEPDSPAATDGLSEDDRELIEEAVVLTLETLVNEQFDEALEFLVPDQRESAGRLLEQVALVAQAQKALEAAIEEIAPGALENLTASLGGGLGGGMFGGEGAPKDAKELLALLEVGEITLAEEDQAVARIGMKGAGSQTLPLPLQLIDDDWFVRVPLLFDDSELVDGLIDVLKVIDRKVRELNGQIEDGSVGPDMLQPALMQMVPEIMGAFMPLMPKIQALAASFDADASGAATDAPDPESDEDAESEGADDGADDRSGPTDIG